MEEQITKYYRYLQDTRQMAENTCLAYKRDLSHFAEYLSWNHITNPSEVSVSDINKYLDYIKSKGKSPATTARTICSIRGFFDYLGKDNPANAVELPKVLKKEKKVVSREEADNRISNIEGSHDKALRDRAMLSLMYDADLKASQITSLRMDDIDTVACFVRINKSGKQQYPAFCKATKDALTEYIEKVRPSMVASSYTKELFVNCDGRPLSRQGLWKIIKSYK